MGTGYIRTLSSGGAIDFIASNNWTSEGLTRRRINYSPFLNERGRKSAVQIKEFPTDFLFITPE